MYPGLVASLCDKDGVDGVDGGLSPAEAGAGAGAALSGSVAGSIIYPKAVEAFLSNTDRPPCCQGAGGRVLTAAAAAAALETNPTCNGSAGSRSSAAAGPPPISCRCYEGTTGELSGRSHDPQEALEALRPASRSPPQQLRRTDSNPGKSSRTSHGGDASTRPGSAGKGKGKGEGGVDNGGSESEEPATTTMTTEAVDVDPLGAVLLLCEVLRSEGRVSAAAEAVGPRLRLQRECCGWVLDHLAALFPGWVDTASVSAAGDFVGAATDARAASAQGVAPALCDEVATALGLFVCRRALNGEFQEAQVRQGKARLGGGSHMVLTGRERRVLGASFARSYIGGYRHQRSRASGCPCQQERVLFFRRQPQDCVEALGGGGGTGAVEHVR